MKATLKKKNSVGGLPFLDFKTYYKVTVIDTVWYQHKDKQINQQITGEYRNRSTRI